MPFMVKFNYEDGTEEVLRFPAEVWRLNDVQAKKIIPTSKRNIPASFSPDLAQNLWLLTVLNLLRASVFRKTLKPYFQFSLKVVSLFNFDFTAVCFNIS